MEYTLGMGFYGTVYKKIPTIQVFVGDRLIDEYQPESLDSYETYDPLQKFFQNNLIPKYFKLYTLDEKFLKNQSTIKLNIKNADSNYSNSFMTKSTIMNMSNIFLIPTKIFKHYPKKNFRQKELDEFYSNIKDIIPSSEATKFILGYKEWDNIHDAKYNDSWFKGYPYPFKYFWNNETIPNSLRCFFGGNGTLKFALIYTNNTVMFDYYEDQLLKLIKDGWEIVGERGLKLSGKMNYVVSGFPFCTEFSVLSHILNSNK